MNVDLIIWIIKSFFINIYTYFIFLKIKNYNKLKFMQMLEIFGISIIETIIYCILKRYTNQFVIVMLNFFIQIIFLKIFLKYRNELVITTNLVSNAIVYIVFGISTLIEFFISNIFSIKNSIINLVIILVIEFIILRGIFNIKRFNKGLSFLKSSKDNEHLEIIMINIGAITIFAYCLFGNYDKNLTKDIFIPFLLLGLVIIIIIQKTLMLYYKQKLLVKTIEEYKNEISEKDAQIQKLSAEKYKISKLNHEFYNRQKSLERKVNEIVTKANLNMETASELGVMDQISSLTKEYSAKLEEIKELDQLPSTDIEEIDDMFKYMQSECKQNNIDFKLKINGNIHHLVNTIIPQNKLVTLIGDHLRDAIIAVNSSSNSYKSIIAILGVKDNTYEFCVYDTGIEFEIDTLLKLGLEPATTHKETGGTGIGFMTTFETLKETNASLIIEEKHEMNDNDYTKAVIIRFDGKNEYKIRSYRSKQIGKSDRIIIEKI